MNRKLIATLISLLTLGASGSLFAAAACCSPAAAAKNAEAASPTRMILASYEKVSNALAADDLALAQSAARTFAAITDITDTKLKCGGKKSGCDSEAKAAKKDCDVVSKGCTKSLQAFINAGNIEEARAQFKLVSAQAIELARKEEGYVVMTCPMAGENGDWLQSDKEVRNPYHGSKMLRCGMVKPQVNASADTSVIEG